VIAPIEKKALRMTERTQKSLLFSAVLVTTAVVTFYLFG
jgi:hypothetical protein